MRSFRTGFLILALLTHWLACNTYAQQGKSGTTAPANLSNADAKKQADAIRSLEQQLATAFNLASPDPGDYIPCEFTVPQLLNLRPQPETALLSSADEAKLKDAVTAQTLAQSEAGVFPKSEAAEFIDRVSKTTLAGRSPGEALAKVISILQDVRSKNDNDAAVVDSVLQVAPPSVQDKLRPALLGEINGSDRWEKYQSLRPAVENFFADPKNAELERQFTTAEITTTKRSIQDMIDEKKKAASPAAPQAIVDSARVTISVFQRPLDIGCAMAILDWNTTRYAFGRSIADQYIAVQIVVRNLNANFEFLVHDAELAVDTDINGRHGRFFSGVDKRTVRTYTLSARDFNRRNLIVNFVQGIDTVLSAVTPIYGTTVKNASSVYHAFTTAVPDVWKDHDTDQLNLLNDAGFSASKTEQTVVPKSGSAMFVIFVESKPLEQAWWTQDCANVQILATSESKNGEAATGQAAGTEAETEMETKTTTQTDLSQLNPPPRAQQGVDVDGPRRVCIKQANDKGNLTSALGPDGKTTYYYVKPEGHRYKDWSAHAKDIFRELAFAVVAGTHVVQQVSTQPSVTKLDCPKDKAGDLDFDAATNGTLSCKLTGTNLGSVQTLRLRNAQDATDTKVVEGAVSISGDATSATAALPLAQIGVLEKPAYKAYTVTKDGVEADTGQAVNLALAPFFSADPDPKEIPLDKLSAKGAQAVTVKLTGFHLDKVTGVNLENSAKTIKMDTDKPLSNQSATGFSFTVTPQMIAKAKIPPATKPDDVKFGISLTPKDAANTTKIQLQGTGQITPPAAPAPAKKQPSTNPAGQKGAPK